MHVLQLQKYFVSRKCGLEYVQCLFVLYELLSAMIVLKIWIEPLISLIKQDGIVEIREDYVDEAL